MPRVYAPRFLRHDRDSTYRDRWRRGPRLNFDPAPTPVRIQQCLGPPGSLRFGGSREACGQRVLWGDGQSLDHVSVGSRKMRSPVACHKGGGHLDKSRADHCLDVSRIEYQGALEEAARMWRVFGDPPLIFQTIP